MKEIKTGKVVLGIVGTLMILVIAQIAAQLIASLLVAIHVPAFICNIIAGILYVVFAYLLLKIYAKKVLSLQLSELGIPKFKVKMKWLLTAFVLPLVVTGIYFLMPGDLQKGNMDLAETVTAISAGIFFTGIGAGIVEEMVFRGFIMNLLDAKMGRKAGILIPSLFFGALHIIGMNFSILSCLQVLIAGTFVGIMFSLIALERHSVWNGAVVHAMWNIIILGGFLSIGETPDEYSAFSYILKTRSFAITGGEFGIESSIIAIVGYVIVTLIAYTCIRKNGFAFCGKRVSIGTTIEKEV
ncbi:MAG: CPBP family intramembrane metalloprotease [Lachnospiraceae bacterium]|nr:CPBP family intramembrane metalloprotease [Lachnospiraceae bacterium]